MYELKLSNQRLPFPSLIVAAISLSCLGEPLAQSPMPTDIS
jgi:hypothetical protein